MLRDWRGRDPEIKLVLLMRIRGERKGGSVVAGGISERLCPSYGVESGRLRLHV